MPIFLSIVAEICFRNFPVFFLAVPGSTATTVEQLLQLPMRWCSLDTLFELAAKKNWHKSRPKRKRIHARMIESSMYRYISDIDRDESKNSAAYRVLWISL